MIETIKYIFLIIMAPSLIFNIIYCIKEEVADERVSLKSCPEICGFGGKHKEEQKKCEEIQNLVSMFMDNQITYDELSRKRQGIIGSRHPGTRFAQYVRKVEERSDRRMYDDSEVLRERMSDRLYKSMLLEISSSHVSGNHLLPQLLIIPEVPYISNASGNHPLPHLALLFRTISIMK